MTPGRMSPCHGCPPLTPLPWAAGLLPILAHVSWSQLVPAGLSRYQLLPASACGLWSPEYRARGGPAHRPPAPWLVAPGLHRPTCSLQGCSSISWQYVLAGPAAPGVPARRAARRAGESRRGCRRAAGGGGSPGSAHPADVL